ncbi:MAG TPA: hypothetical protein VNZ49_02895 [Bacteroidia bacterium]|jgi:hypothetical protein|nr:hypothetical protein [Bacteroidia bacterium]
MEKIELRKIRDFGALFNDGIAFLRKNYKSFFGSIIFLAGPFIIITALISGYLQSLQSALMGGNIFTSLRLGSTGGLMSANFIGTLTIFILLSMLTTLVTTACICLYFKEYDKTSAENLPISRSLISPNLAPACWRLFYNLLLLALLMGLAGLLIVGVCAVLFIIPVINVLVGIGLVVGIIIIVPVLIYILYVTNYIIIRDEVMVTDAIGKAYRYVRGNFWWTWLLMVAVGICVGTAASIFSLPITIINFTKAFTRAYDSSGGTGNSSMLIIIFGALSVVGQLLVVSPILYTFCIFNFYNNEERHEGTGLMSRIDEFDVK